MVYALGPNPNSVLINLEFLYQTIKKNANIANPYNPGLLSGQVLHAEFLNKEQLVLLYFLSHPSASPVKEVKLRHNIHSKANKRTLRQRGDWPWTYVPSRHLNHYCTLILKMAPGNIDMWAKAGSEGTWCRQGWFNIAWGSRWPLPLVISSQWPDVSFDIWLFIN